MKEKDLPIDLTKHTVYTKNAKKCVQKHRWWSDDVEEKERITKELQNIVRLYQYDVDRIEKLKQEKEKEVEKDSTSKLLEELEQLKKQLEDAKKLNEAMTIIRIIICLV